MTDYTELDAAILEAVGNGLTTFNRIRFCEPVDYAAECIKALTRHATWRVVDLRLQALRKAGRITYDRKAGWRIA